MTEEQSGAAQPFLEAYDRIRREEQWGGDDLDLPFHPRRHLDVWAIRRRTFRKFESLAVPLDRGFALDLGAGNCWLTRHLHRWGFDAIAVDVNTSETDGLRAGQKYLDEGARFLRVRAAMERLPFASGQIKLVAANASFHYAGDFRAALAEFERVLAPGGLIAIIDSPFYSKNADGERMIAGRVVDYRRKYGVSETLAGRARYLTFKEVEAMMPVLNLKCRLHPVWPGLRRKYEEIRGAFARRRVAQFPIVVFEKSES